MKIRVLIMLITICCMHTVALAGTNGSLSGKITSKSDGKPLSGITVKVLGTTRGAFSKATGKYTVINIPSGTYNVQYSAIGKKTVIVRGVLINPDQETERNVVIADSVSTTGEVVVTAGKLIDDKKVGVSTEVDGGQIQRTTRESALQIATTQAGVTGGAGGFTIRGSRNTDTQVRIDGQEITDMVSGGVGSGAARGGGLDYAPTASGFATEVVQVQTSNFGAQYGNATGGVVNQTIKTGRTDSYEGYLRYRTDVPFLFGSNSSNGAKALAGLENTYEFGVGGPLQIISGSTFFLSSRFFHEQYRNNGLDVRDRGGNSLGQLENNSSQVRNITGRMTFQLTDKIKAIVGGTWGLTTLAQGGWDWMYAKSPAMTFARNPQTGLNDTTIYSTVPENIAKTNVLNNFIYSYFFRVNHILTDVSFYEATLSYNNNITEDARRVIDLGTGSPYRNGQIVDPSRVTTSARGPNFFSGYDLMTPTDTYKVNPSGDGLVIERDPVTGLISGDKVVDFYTETSGSIIRDGRVNDPEASIRALVPNQLTGYVEGGEDLSSTTNPYGLRRIFSARGNNDGGGRGRGFEFRMADAIQFESNFQTQIETGGGTKHLIRTGIDGRYYFVHRYSNSLPWTGNPFYDVYTNMYGGDIYSQTDVERKAGSEPKNAAMVALYAEDQIRYKGININPSVRLDVFDPSTTYRVDPTADVSSGEQKKASVKVQVNPRVYISYPINTDGTTFFSIAYGVFTQIPRFENLYNSITSRLVRGNQIISNPDLRPERTNQFNVSYNTQLSDDFSFDVSAYYKDIYNLTGLAFVSTNVFGYSVVANGEYGNSRGLEFTLRRRIANNFGFNLNYTLSYAQGTSSSVGTNYNLILGGADPFTGKISFPLVESPLDFDRRHRINYIFDIMWGDNEGPSIAGYKFLQNLNINFTGLYQTGTPFTRLDFKGQQAGDFNGERQPSIWTVDMRIQKRFMLRDWFGESLGNTSLEIFADFNNLLNRTAPASVYAITMDPDNDGTSLYRNRGEFVGPWYKTPDANNPATLNATQYDQVGNRLYNKATDFDNDGVVTQDEQFRMWFNYVNDAIARKQLYQFPRTVFFGLMLRF